MFKKIEDFINKTQALFAKIGKTGFVKTFLGALSELLEFVNKEEGKQIVDAINEGL